MAKQPEKAPAAEQKPAPEQKITADEFGIRVSENDNRVEMISAFVADEKRAKRPADLESAYRARLEKFAKRPA